MRRASLAASYGDMLRLALFTTAPLVILEFVNDRLGRPVSVGFLIRFTLLVAARARPEAVTCGSSGVGSLGHLAMIRFEQQAGIRVAAQGTPQNR